MEELFALAFGIGLIAAAIRLFLQFVAFVISGLLLLGVAILALLTFAALLA